MAYLPIEHHGIIGDLRTAALVGLDGSIVWLCLPHFDSPSVFAAILDEKHGGSFAIHAVSDQVRRRQMYLPDTNVLLTRFLTPDGVAEIVDFMPIAVGAPADAPSRVVRILRGVRGSIPMQIMCMPRFDYARLEIAPVRIEGGVRWRAGAWSLELQTTLPLEVHDTGVIGECVLQAGDEIPFVVQLGDGPGQELLPTCQSDFKSTVRFWQDWIGRSVYEGRWREMVKRSCLALKLLTFAPTGAIVAAATTSLPEQLGGTRNWDYRYVWIRDAAFTIYAFIRTGFTQEAEAFMHFIEARCRDLADDEGLRVLYGIDGRTHVPESVLDHLEGYRGSAPVRIGNDASSQLQLDITGELVDCLYLINKHCRPLSHDVWVQVRRLADWTCAHWQRPDHGIWERRAKPTHHTFSKMMCWVALDRAHRIALKRGLPGNRDRWLRNRDAIYETIMKRGYADGNGSFVSELDGEMLDASMLLAPMVKFVSPVDPRMLGTLDAIGRVLASDSLVHRYDPDQWHDGVGGAEGTFSMCSFWLVEAQARAGRLEEARLVFEKMLGYASPLGLYAEEISPTGEALGNFPQALTHLGLISSAHYLSRALDGTGKPL